MNAFLLNHKWERSWLLALFASTSIAALALDTNQPVISLAGSWQFRIDRENVGVAQAWFKQDLPDRIRLPGNMPQNGRGDDVTVNTKWTGAIVDGSYFTAPEYEPYRQPGNIKVPFWLQPDKYYVGPAWYQREVEIPTEWQGQRVVLTLERPHWETRVWLDGNAIGTNNSLSTPHEYDLGAALAPGKHRLSIRVDNRMIVEVGENAHSISDHTQGNWNGIAGRLELSATALVWIDDLQVYPNEATKSVTVKGKLGNATGKAGQGTLKLAAERGSLRPQQSAESAPDAPPKTTGQRRLLPERAIAVTWDTTGGTFEIEYPLGVEAQHWDEFHPALYRLTATLDRSGDSQGRASIGHSRSVTFGLRDISTQGTQFVLNGRKLFIRGTLECCIFPLTGHPPTDTASWRRIIRIAKAYGLNNIRFHSWCPPEAAFVAADELGFYFQVEVAAWATIGQGQLIDQWLYEEADRILQAYGNHPSFLLLASGNEPGGPNHKSYLAKWVNHYKAKDPRRLYTSTSGWPEIPENQFHVTPGPRIQAWGGGLKSRINAHPPETRADYRDFIQQRAAPVISHEIGQWCVYPNFDEIPKYRGYLKPKNFEVFRDTLNAHHLGDLGRDFLLASGKLQTLCYKEDIESALRTPGMGGFQLLDLHDFPGQGTALVGVLDSFWDNKGYVTAAQFSRFCNSTVPLARLSKRVFTTDEKLEADLEAAHFGPAPLTNVATAWKLVDSYGRIMANGTLPSKTIPVDNGIPLGNVSIALDKAPAPRAYRLAVEMALADEKGNTRGLPGYRYANDWDVWVYPVKADTQPPPGVTIVEELGDQALATLDAGSKVLLMIPPGRVKGDKLGQVALGFSSIFWNTAWTRRQAPHTLGIRCDPKHPALASFPTDYHSNWQWWYLVSRAGAMVLDDLPPALRPTVQVIDDWFTNRRLGLVFEAKVGAGKLLVCSIELRKDLDRNPVARQMLHSLLNYMAGEEFKPAVELSVEQVRGLMAQPP
jgi:hypothetical protein